MSKLDAQRAMREARYARNRAAGPSRRETTAADVTPKAPAVRPPRAKAAAAAPAASAPEGERCGHKSMNGRACTREAGHSEKIHRYS